MVILYTFISLLLLVSGGAGLFITLTGSDIGTTIWSIGVIIFGVFLIIGVTVIVGLLTFLVEHD